MRLGLSMKNIAWVVAAIEALVGGRS
jgi:hypothetical protein